MTTFTAQFTEINHERCDGTFWDTVTIFKDGEELDTVVVESTEEPQPYDDAVRDVIGDAEFTWIVGVI